MFIQEMQYMLLSGEERGAFATDKPVFVAYAKRRRQLV